MAKSSISVGDDTPAGEPENGPKGPYITDKDDGMRDPHGQKPAPHEAPSRRRRINQKTR